MAACHVCGHVVELVLQFVNFGEFQKLVGILVAINNCECVWAFAFLQPVSFCIHFVSFLVYLRGCGHVLFSLYK